jgi:hypothetical protein
MLSNDVQTWRTMDRIRMQMGINAPSADCCTAGEVFGTNGSPSGRHNHDANSKPASSGGEAGHLVYINFVTGNLRTLLPVAAKMALQTAGAMGGTPVSPIPPGAL